MPPKREKFKYLETPIDFNQSNMSKILFEGANVVDATCGNGNDSQFIAKNIGINGVLYCFDIQEDAINKTNEKLNGMKDKPKIIMIQKSHENLELYVPDPIDCIFYNLGYLPSSDKSITTKASTTIASLKSAFKILKTHGIISLMIYTEHDNGEEYNQIRSYLATLNQLSYSIAETKFILRKSPPILVLIEKL